MKRHTTPVYALAHSRPQWQALVLLVATLTLSGMAQAQVIFNESFTGGASSTGFTIAQSAGTCGWAYNNPGARNITGAGFDSDFAIFDSDHCGEVGPATGELLSPVFDASAADNWILTFDQSYQGFTGSSGTLDVWNGTAWNTVYTVLTDTGYPDPAVSSTFNISAAANGSTTAQVRFQYTGDDGYWWALDNIVLTGTDCLPPTGLAVTEITPHEGTISWTDNASAGYSWAVTTGAVPDGTNELVEGDGSITTISGLTSNTTYTVWVRADCGDGGYSSWSSGVDFTTPCDASDIPYFEDFSSVSTPAIPACMSIQTVSGNPWTTSTTVVAGMTAPTARVSWTGFGSPDMDSWLYTTGLNLTAGVSYQLIYKYGNTSTSYTEAMSVAYGTGASEADMVNPLIDHPAITGNALHIDTLNFIPATSGVHYIGFKCHSIADQLYLVLDDISVTVTPSCYSPVASYLIAPDCANSQYFVHVDLTDLGDATSVDIMSDYAGNPGGQTGIDSTGEFILGPFANLSTVNISVVHADDDSCSIALDPITYDCADFGKNALSFDGVDDRVDCGSDPSLAITGNAVTMEAWIYPTAWKTNTYQANIVNSEGGNTGYMLRCGDNGKLDLNLGDGAGWDQLISPANTLTLNTWQYVAGTYDGDTMRMYVNGIQVMAQQATFTLAATGTPLVIGDWSNGTGRNFPGKIDEVRVWNTAVSPANIVAHMNTAYCGNETGLVAYYKFDQGIANGANPNDTTLFDLSGYANNGALTGFALDGASSNWVVGVTDMGDCVPVACPAPIQLAITNPTTDGFDISWTNTTASAYAYEVRSSGAPGSGATGLEASGSPASGTPPITISGLAPNADYSVYVRAACDDTLFSDWSPAVSFYLGYCVTTSTSTLYYITDFTTTGGSTNIDNSASGLSTDGYGDFTSMVVTSYPGGTVDFTAGFSADQTYYFYIWADLNNDLDFDDPDESLVAQTTYVPSPFDGTFTIPAGTPLGTYRMRVRNSEFGTVGPCGAGNNGETEDYTLMVVAQEECTGLPDPGATLGPDTICADVPFTLAVENASSDAGLTYQWQTSPDGTAWTDATGATSATYTISQSEETWYRLQVTCEFGDVATSTPLEVSMAPFNECYCASSFTYADGEYVSNVNYAGIDNTSGGDAGGPVDYTDQAAEVEQGDTHTLSVTILADQFEYVYAFIDWNQNGILDDAGEVYTVTSNADTNGPFTLDIITPADAVAGNTHMRVMVDYDNDIPDPCVVDAFGEAEDYTVHVTAVPLDCEGVANGPAMPGTPCYDTPNGWGGTWSAECECELNIGVDEIAGTTGFAIYPNPASSILYITTVNGKPVHVKVYDMVGTLVIEKDMVQQLDITQLATGSYTLVATDSKGGNERHARFMKQ